MKKSIKVFITMFIFVFGICQFSICVLANSNIPSATSDFYVNDFANVFSDDEKTRLIDNAVSLSDEYDGIQVVITTIESLGGSTIEQYALDMYNQYGIGKNDMGLLILLSTGDREIFVSVGRAMEAYINDSKAGRFIDKYAIPSLKENKFNDGLIKLQEAYISEIISCVSSEQLKTSTAASSAKDDSTSNNNADGFNFGKFLFTLMIFFAISGLIIFIAYIIYKKVKQYNEMKAKAFELSNELKEYKNSFSRKCEEFNSRIASFEAEHKKEKELIVAESNEQASYLRQKHEQKEQELNKRINTLSSEIEKITSKYNKLQKEFSVLVDRYERVQKLYPTADADVTAMIEDEIRAYNMQKAGEADSLISEVLNLSASKDIISQIQSAQAVYDCLEDEQKAYVKSNIDKLKHLYSDSVQLKEEYERQLEEERVRRQIAQNKELANDATRTIHAIISSMSIGTASDLEKLQKARDIYENLSYDSRKYFDDSIINRVNELTREAKADYNRLETIRRNRKLAEGATAVITGVIAYMSFGKARDLRNLENAKRAYEELDSNARQYVDSALIDKLDRLIRESRRDKQEEEEAERRRRREEEERRRRREEEERRRRHEEEERRKRQEEERRRRTNYSSSFNSSPSRRSGHSGFGGSSRGGGAKRGF